MPAGIHGIGLNLLFAAGVCAAWAWFNVAPTSSGERYRFSISTNIPGWRFEPVSLNAKVTQTLATTNIVNGIFHGPKNERISLFLGNWNADKVRELSVVAHTPDVCWIGAGWIPIPTDHGNPKDVLVAQKVIPFEVRLFRLPNSDHEELTFWCTLVNGQPYSELYRFHPTQAETADSSFQASNSARRLAGSHFISSLKKRTIGKAEKQFIRFSVEKSQNMQKTSASLQDFIQHNITIVE